MIKKLDIILTCITILASFIMIILFALKEDVSNCLLSMVLGCTQCNHLDNIYLIYKNNG